MAKDQFQSSEDLVVMLGPHVNKTDGTDIVGDTLTVTVVAPNGDVLSNPGDFADPVQDANTNIWKIILPVTLLTVARKVAPYLWRLKSVSSNINALVQRKVLTWGDYVDDVTASKTAAESADGKATAIQAKTDNLPSDPADESALEAVIGDLDTKLGMPAGASVSADVAAVKADTEAIKLKTDALPATPASQGDVTTVGTAVAGLDTKLGTPAGVSVSADVAAVKGDTSNTLTRTLDIQEKITRVQKISEGRYKVVGNQLIIYDADGSTPLLTFNLFDDAGAPTMSRIYERVPV